MHNASSFWLIIEAIALILAVFVLPVAGFFLFTRHEKRKTRERIEKLRQSGALSGAEVGEADIVRLANSGRGEEAALLYVALRGGRIAAARESVGYRTTPSLSFVIFFTVLAVTGTAFRLLDGMPPKAIAPALLCYLAFLAYYWEKRIAVRRNRARIAQGHLFPAKDRPSDFMG